MANSTEQLTTILQNIKFNGRIPANASVSLDRCSELSKQYKSAMVDGEIVQKVISDIAFDKQLENTKAPDFNLVPFEGALLSEMLEEIDNELKALPKFYEFVFNLPHADTPITLLQLTPNIEILTLQKEADIYSPAPKSQNSQQKTLRSVLQALQEPTRNSKQGLKLKPDDTILRVKVRGYIGDYGTISLISQNDDPLYVYKVIMGYYLNQDIFEYSFKNNLFDKSPLTYSVVDNSAYHIVRSFDGDTEDGYLLTRNSYKPEAFTLSASAKANSINKTPLDLAHLQLKRIFTDLTDKTIPEDLRNQQRRLKNGLYWFYEAQKAPQTFLKITSTISALDALLASDHNTKKEYKADIISQVVAKNVIEEQQIETRILKLYKLRNSIVHGETSVSSLDSYTPEGKENRHSAMLGLGTLASYLKIKLDKFTNIPWA